MRGPVSSIGRAGKNRPLIQSQAEIRTKTPTVIKRRQVEGPKHHIIGTDSAFEEFMGRLRVSRVDESETPRAHGDGIPAYVHFPDTADPVLFEQLTSHKMVLTYTKQGLPQRVQKKISDRNDEALDGVIMARAALQLLGQPVINQLAELAKHASALRDQSEGKPPAASQQPEPPPQQGRRVTQAFKW
jgi:phage terminase large subunit GpA-like protein